MKRYTIMPDGGKWLDVNAETAEMAFAGSSCWFMPMQKVGVCEWETGNLSVFRKEVDKDGNLIQNRRLK